MDAQRQQTLWAIALENYQAGVLTTQHGWYNVSVTRSYYAVFMAMWVALGDPPKGRWEHGGIVEQFVHGQWCTPPMPVARDLTRAIRRLYADRVDADYGTVRLTSLESTVSLTTARQVVRLIADTLSFSLGGISL
jgi:uncharacterized protein (UPF0332 family)